MENLTTQDYKNLVNEFSYYNDIKPEIYRILKYEYNIEDYKTDDEVSKLVFKIQDKICKMYKNTKLNKY